MNLIWLALYLGGINLAISGFLASPTATFALVLVLHALLILPTVLFTTRLSIVSGGSVGFGLAGALLMILPPLPLVLLHLVNQRATQLLNRHGVAVGFFGARGEELRKLLRSCCAGCGYDLRGLQGSTCPECGHSFDPADLPAPAR